MICNVCNKEVEENVRVCPFCGASLTINECKVIEVEFKKPEPPPVIVVEFVEPELEPEPIPEPKPEPIPEPEPEPIPEPEPEPIPEPKPVKKEKPAKKPKSKDRINPLFLLVSLLWAPYPGIALWVMNSKKAPKSSQVYGICAIIMAILKQAVKAIKRTIATALVVLLLVLCAVASIVLVIIQLNITFPIMPVA